MLMRAKRSLSEASSTYSRHHGNRLSSAFIQMLLGNMEPGAKQIETVIFVFVGVYVFTGIVCFLVQNIFYPLLVLNNGYLYLNYIHDIIILHVCIGVYAL